MRSWEIKLPSDFSAGFFLILALGLLVLPLKWCFAWVAATLIHELSHALAVRLCGGRVAGLHFGARGITIQADPLPHGKALICSLAGPISGFLLLLFVGQIPRIALCALVQSVNNLQPLSSLDGGHALRHLLQLFLPQSVTDRICCVAEKVFLILLAVLAVFACFFLRWGVLPLLVAGITWMKTRAGNTSCKSAQQRVQ